MPSSAYYHRWVLFGVSGQIATGQNATRTKCHKRVNVKDYGPHVVVRLWSGLGSGPDVVGRLGSGMRVSASFQLRQITLYRLALVLYIHSFVAFCPALFCPVAFCPGLCFRG